MEEELEKSKKEILVDGIDHLIKTIEDMPTSARMSSLTQYDQLAMLLIMKEMLDLKDCRDPP